MTHNRKQDFGYLLSSSRGSPKPIRHFSHNQNMCHQFFKECTCIRWITGGVVRLFRTTAFANDIHSWQFPFWKSSQCIWRKHNKGGTGVVSILEITQSIFNANHAEGCRFNFKKGAHIFPTRLTRAHSRAHSRACCFVKHSDIAVMVPGWLRSNCQFANVVGILAWKSERCLYGM